MSSGENLDPTNFNHMGESSASVTTMELDSATLGYLETTLREYREHNEGFEGESLEEQVTAYGPDRYVPIFKETILSLVLDLANEKGRDLERQPVLLPEVVEETIEFTGYDVSGAAAIPFIYNENEGKYEPDLVRLFHEATLLDIAFSEAYAIVQQDVRGVSSGRVTGPSGLPDMDFLEKDQ